MDLALSATVSVAAVTTTPVLALSLTAMDLRHALAFVVCFVVATAFHEYAHAITARRLGDRTGESEGRVTLNPLAHADPIGTIAMPLLAGIFHYPPLGWGRPVPFQPAHFTRKISMRAGSALVSVAGPLANVVQAVITVGVAAVLVFAIKLQPAQHPGVFAILGVFLTLNMMLAVFNLLPIHPLDGGKILSWALPPRFDYIDDFLTRYGWAILLGLMFAAPQVLGYVFTPLYILAAKLMAAISPDWADQYVQWLRPAR